jgi:asparagine synthase (glutamine-hydrolysing)
MCGIVGFTRPGRDAHRLLGAMNAALAHRGPDADTVFVDSTIALGHRRLAIVDLTGGAQPRVDAASGDALVFNGEIFGYRRLAAALQADGVVLRDRSDTEVLFQLLRRYGVSHTLERIDGQFAFAFRDSATGALHLVRDRFGEKPLYYGLAGRQLVFASEASALLAHPAFAHASPDRLAAYQFLSFEYLPGTASGWDGIAKIEPGSILTFSNGDLRTGRYWRPQLVPTAPMVNERTATDQLDELLTASVRDRLVADVPVGVFLSGGIDSSLITALAVRAAPNITAFTVRIGGDNFDETPHAITVARFLGVRHEVVTLEEEDLLDAFDAIGDKLAEPLGDSSLLPTYLVCRAARRLMTVALGGDGADELFAGYPNFLVQRFAPAMRLVPSAFGRLAGQAIESLPRGEGYMNWPFIAAQLAQGLGVATLRQSFLWMAPFAPSAMSSLWKRAALPPGAFDAAFAPIERRAADAGALRGVERLLYLFLTTYLPEDILTKTDRASMFNSLEVRAPFLDRSFSTYACALPTALKLNGGRRKYVLKLLARRYLPAGIVERKKHGFAVPIGRYLRTLFRERCRDVLLSCDNPVAGWFDRAAIERMLDAHLSGRQELGKKLWSLYVLFAVAARRSQSALAAPTASARQTVLAKESPDV